MSENEDKDLSRRDFIKTTAALISGFIGAAIALPGIGYLLSPSLGKNNENAWIDLGDSKHYPIGVPTLFQFTRTEVNGWERTAMSYGVFVVRQEDEHVRVFSNICTHLGCHVIWHPEIQNYVSPCHDGHFDTMGKNISGPPPRPLDEFKTRVEAGNLAIDMPPIRWHA